MRQLSVLDNLIHVHRYSGNLLIKDESVSDHVWGMISLALEYVPKLNSDEKLVDLKDIIFGIAVHDLDEALTGDIPRPFKYNNAEILDAIRSTSNDILYKTVGEDLYCEIKDITMRDTPVGLLVKIFDVAQAGFKMTSEIKLGNEYFRGELNNIFDCFGGLIDDCNGLMPIKYRDPFINLINEFSDCFRSSIK